MHAIEELESRLLHAEQVLLRVADGDFAIDLGSSQDPLSSLEMGALAAGLPKRTNAPTGSP